MTTDVTELLTPEHPPLPWFLPTWEQIYDGLAKRLIRGNRRGDLLILNYTQKAVYGREWSHPAVKACRGLVVNTATGEVVALPFPKFFNFSEPVGLNAVPALPPGEPEYTEKLDGALGILYRHPKRDEVLWTTRGSFGSEEAQIAQDIWDEQYDSPRTRGLLFGLFNSLTLLVETIAPETRQVVNYQGAEKLVIIGARDRFSGRDLHWDSLVNVARTLEMPLARRVEGDTVRDDRGQTQWIEPNQPDRTWGTFTGLREGVVARYDVDTCPYCDAWKRGCPLCGGIVNAVYRLKFKTAEYVKLHRLKTKCTPRRIARAWEDGTLTALLPSLPEEYRAEVEQTVAALEAAEWGAQLAVIAGYTQESPFESDRKTFALWVNQNVVPHRRGSYFRLFDGKLLDLKKEIVAWFIGELPPEQWVKEDE